MNYKKIYYDLCHYCQTVDKVDRLYKRNNADPRLNNLDDIYTEVHHIIPKHSGGTDDKSNLVEMLPEEHLMAHLIRYKAYNSQSDFIAVRFIINGFQNKTYLIDRYPDTFLNNKTFLKKYALFRNMIYGFRKEHGWQTAEGRERISKARTGTFPCVDSETGESVGSHHRDHPNILSGKWVHHSKGKVCVMNIETMQKEHITTEERAANPHKYKTLCKSGAGSKNNNYKEMTPEMRLRVLEIALETSDEGFFCRGEFGAAIKNEFSKIFKKISTAWVFNNFGSVEQLLSEVKTTLGEELKYSPKRKSKAHRQKLSESSKYNWVTDGEKNVRIKNCELANFIKNNPNFKKGRVSVKN